MDLVDKDRVFIESLLEQYNQEKAKFQEIEKSFQEQKQILFHYEGIIQYISKKKVFEKIIFDFQKLEATQQEKKIGVSEVVQISSHQKEIETLGSQKLMTDYWDSELEHSTSVIHSKSRDTEGAHTDSPSTPIVETNLDEGLRDGKSGRNEAQEDEPLPPLEFPVEVDESNTITEIDSEPSVVEKSENSARQLEEFSSGSEFFQSEKMTPKQMLRPRFQRMSQKEVIIEILEEANRPLKTIDVTEEAYDCKTEDDFKRASDSMGTALRHGAGKFWNKLSERGGGFVHKNFSLKPPSHLTDRQITPDRLRSVASTVKNGRV